MGLEFILTADDDCLRRSLGDELTCYLLTVIGKDFNLASYSLILHIARRVNTR